MIKDMIAETASSKNPRIFLFGSGKRRYLNYLLIALLFQTLLSFIVFVLMNKYGKWPDQTQSVFSAWDAHHYQYLAQYGYQNHGDEANFIVFFPLYPLIVRAFMFIIPSVTYASLLVTAIFSIIAHFLYFILLDNTNLDRRVKVLSTLLFFLTPINAYFFAAYTESLYLCLVLAFFILISRRNYLTASLIAMCAVLTRSVGILLIAPFLFQIFVDKNIKPIGHAAKATPIVLGYLVYLVINTFVFGSPLHYKYVMETHWYKSVVNPVSTYRNLFGDFPSNIFHRVSLTMRVDNVMVVFLPLLLVFYFLFKRHRLPYSWILWVMVNWFVIASQSYLLSSTRYILVLFPVYIIIPLLIPRQKIFIPLTLALVALFGYLSWVGVDLYSKGAWLY